MKKPEKEIKLLAKYIKKLCRKSLKDLTEYSKTVEEKDPNEVYIMFQNTIQHYFFIKKIILTYDEIISISKKNNLDYYNYLMDKQSVEQKQKNIISRSIESYFEG